MRKTEQIDQTEVERVYQAIYDHLKRKHTLPTYRQLIRRLQMNMDDLRDCVTRLREENRIERTTLLPTDFRQRWRELKPLRDPQTNLPVAG